VTPCSWTILWSFDETAICATAGADARHDAAIPAVVCATKSEARSLLNIPSVFENSDQHIVFARTSRCPKT
jgi:hypothetical protein